MVFLRLKGRKGILVTFCSHLLNGCMTSPILMLNRTVTFFGRKWLVLPSSKHSFNKKQEHLTTFQTSRRGSFFEQQTATFRCTGITSSMAPVHLALGVLVEPKRSDSRHPGEMLFKSYESKNPKFSLDKRKRKPKLCMPLGGTGTIIINMIWR